MAQWIFTSSLLILAVLAVRGLAGDRISARLRYGLWALVLVRLLVPVQLGSSPVSVLNLAETIEITQKTETAHTPVMPQSFDTEQTSQTTQTTEQTQTNETAQQTETSVVLEQAPEAAAHNPLLLVWGLGMVLMGGVLLGSNLQFAARLRRSRVPLAQGSYPVTVYVTEAVDTGCLFGGLRPSVYITRELAADETTLQYVLTHELTHYKHKDHIWALLRCLCVTVHWYNPLVWLAAVISQRDGELACDEGALAVLGEGARMSYARTLLDMTCRGYRGLLTTATSMTGSENDLKQRIVRIVKNPKTKRAALGAVAMAVAVLAVCLFTGQQRDPLGGTWRAVNYESAPYPQWKAEVTVEVIIRDGRMRAIFYQDGAYHYARDFYYTLEGDTLTLEETDYKITYTYTLQKAGDTLTFIRENGITEGTLTRGEEQEFPLVPDRLMEVKRFYWLQDGEMAVTGDAYLTIPECGLMALLETCTISDSYPAELPAVANGYGAVLEDSRGTSRLLFADGVLYLNDMAYVPDSTEAFQDFFEGLGLQFLAGSIDEFGMRYTLSNQDGPDIQMDMPHGYGESRFYNIEDRAALDAAIAQLRENAIAGDSDPLTEGESRVLLITDVEGLSYLNVYSNGIIWFQMFGENGGTNCYVLPEDIPLLTELLSPYVQIYEASAARAEGKVNCDGRWILTAPVGEVTELKLTLDSEARLQSLNNRTGNLRARLKERAVERAFDYYLQEGVFHLRWTDGTETSVPCRYDGDTLTMQTQTGEWRFRRSVPEDNVLRGDVLRFRRNVSVDNTLAVDLSPSSLAALEALLREGMELQEDNFIVVRDYYYKLDGLEEAFETTDVTLSDYGTLHFNGESYKLENWDAVEAYLNAIFITK